MWGDCHIHVIMDGVNYRHAVDIHKAEVDESVIHLCFQRYQELGVTFLRDGGDARHVSERARQIAPLYGIDYRTPLYAIHKHGHYGGIVGLGFDTLDEYRELVRQVVKQGGDFIKIMISGLIDFSRVGVLSEEGLPADWIREMIHIAHEEGMAVMAHANGSETVKAALEAGIDSIEHGAFMDEECVDLLAESSAVWVPTLSPAANMIGKGRFDDGVLREIVAIHSERIRQAVEKGARVALGSDAGAWQVLHGQAVMDEYHHLQSAIPDSRLLDQRLEEAEAFIRERFCWKA